MSVADRIHARVGAEIRSNRITAGLSLNDVSAATGVPVDDIDNLEQGIITLRWRRIEDIIDTIGLPMKSVVHLDGPLSTAS